MNKIAVFKYPLIFDGAFGTYCRTISGSPEGITCESMTLSAPRIVYNIHREYIDAGCTAIKTDSFAANPYAIKSKSILDATLDAAFSIASRAALAGNRGIDMGKDSDRGSIKVFADIGGISSDDINAAEDYLYVTRKFIELGAKNILFETLDSLEPVVPAINYARRNGAFIAVSFAVSQDGYTLCGEYYAGLIGRALALCDIAGLNCVCGPSHIAALMAKLPYERKRLLAMPNAGYPVRIDGRLCYRDNPEYFASRTAELVRLGIGSVGGCCGTTPAHIGQLVGAIEKIAEDEALHTAQNMSSVTVSGENTADISRNYEIKEENKADHRASLRKKLDSGIFAVAVEIDPPLDTDCSFMLSSAAALRDAGADILTIADSPLARARADSLAMAAKIKRETALDVLAHLSCRDRNGIAVRASLTAANIEGVRNILCVTGDAAPCGAGKRPEDYSENVYSFNSIKLMNYISSLNADIFGAAPYDIAGALNVNAVNFASELERAKKKRQAGAYLFLTQAIFTEQALENLKRARGELENVYIMAGILPLAGYKNAVFLDNEVAGITIPAHIIAALEGKNREEATEISLGFASSLIDRSRHFCDGIYLMTPLKRVDLTLKLLEYIKTLNKDEKNADNR